MVAKQHVAEGAKETLGQRMARLRKLRGLTQIELAERIGLAQSNVSDYERDVFRPNSDMLLRIARSLRISADELLGLRPVPKGPPLTRRLTRRIAQIEKLPPSDQRAVLKFVDALLQNRGVG